MTAMGSETERVSSTTSDELGARDDQDSGAPSVDRSDVGRAFSYSFKVFLVMRIGLTALALAAIGIVPGNQSTDVPGWPAPPPEAGYSNIATSFERWDALWFLRIAEDGYAEDDGSAAFFPLYPLVVRGVSTALGGHPLPAALLVSNAAFLAALILVYLLTRIEFDDQTARRTTLYMSVWPTAFFFIAPYSESLFLMLTAGSFLSARTRRWGLAALLGALAAATRSIGIVLVAALAVEAVSQFREDESKDPRALMRSLVGAAGAGLGTLAYLAFWKASAGNWFAPVGEQGNWLREFSFPVTTLIDGTRVAFRFIGQGFGGYALMDWFIVVPALGAGLWVAARSRPAYGVYVWASLLIPLTFIFSERPFMSIPRFTVVMWPLFWALAHVAKRWNAHEALVACSAVGLGLFTTLFVNWYWIF